MKIKCLAIDDEPFALEQIVGYINKTPFLELADKCYNAFEAMEILANQHIDLIFIDINMPEMSGMDFIKSLETQPIVIFTTAYSEYAIESYKVDALDYLLKPITYSDFLRASNKAQKFYIQTNSKEHSEPENYIFIKSENKLLKINFDDVEYIESMSEYVRIHLINEKPIMCLMSLKNLEQSLPEDIFMRVHRSYIVNLQKVTTIERNRIIYKNNVSIPVSEQYKQNFKNYLKKYFL